MLGLSVDSVYSHLAWIDSIKNTFQADIPFPVIADLDLKVARLYGMAGSGAGTSAVRSVFFIDPNSTIRATLSYPAAIGRNIDLSGEHRQRGVRHSRQLDTGAAHLKSSPLVD